MASKIEEEEIAPLFISDSFLKQARQLSIVSEDVVDEKSEGETVDARVDKLFDDIGGCGLFQVFAFITVAWGMSAQSWYFYGLGFLTQPPDYYICTYNGVPDPNICIKENICADDPRIATWEADPDHSHTLYNWQQKLDLTCVE